MKTRPWARYVALSALVLTFGTGFDLCGAVAINFNVPVSLEFTVNGTGDEASAEQQFCLSDYSAQMEQYLNHIDDLEYASGSYLTVSYSPDGATGLTADITVTVKDPGGSVIFTQTLTDADPGDYVSSSYDLTLTAAEVANWAAYAQLLIAGGADCLTASISATRTDDATGDWSISGKVDMELKIVARPLE